jgi:protein-tyrosine-phosphatase
MATPLGCLVGKFSVAEDKRKRVLFVCWGNCCRSPMAEAIARLDAADVIEASSAGLAPLSFVAGVTIKTLTANGYSADELESKPVRHSAIEAADIIINMSGWSRELAFEDASKVEDWDVEDPYGSDGALYQRICEDIQHRVAELADRLRRSQKAASNSRNDVSTSKGKR